MSPSPSGVATGPHGIQVQVTSTYVAEASVPAEGRYVFAYEVTIRNLGPRTTRLLDRHWLITDADGDVQEVRGDGVVGQQPLLAPGESHRYTSGSVLTTPVGSMQGSYGFIDETGERYRTPIPTFTLAQPGQLN